MQRKWLIIPGLAALSGGLALAQFGGVFTDPVQAGHAAVQIQKAIQEEQTLLQQVNLTLMTYQMAYANVRAFTSKEAWKAYARSVYYPMAPNFYGETVGWNNAVNYGFNPLATWQNVTVAVHPPRPAAQTGQSPSLATVDIADGTSVTAMQNVADARKAQAADAQALNRYEMTVMDTSVRSNSEIEQLNLLTTGAALHARQVQSQNALLTTMAEQGMIANKIQRDRIAEQINSQATQDHYAATAPVAWGETARTISSY
jgi:hypothetical protein